MSVTFRSRGIIKEGLTSDLISSSNKNLNNWSINGGVDITFNQNINNISFSASTDGVLSAMRAWKFTQNVLSDSEFEEFVSLANTKFGSELWKIYAVWAQYEGHMQCITFGAVPVSYNMIYNQSIYSWGSNGWQKDGTLDSYTCVVWRKEWIAGQDATSSNIWNKNSLENTYISNTNYYSGYGMSYSNFNINLNFGGNIIQNFTVENSKLYYLLFDLNNLYEFGGTNTVELTSGNNQEIITLDGSETNTNHKYKANIISDGLTINIKFNFSNIENIIGQIEINISDISLYKLGD